ncbi:xanthine dehydrogenase family protein molybdopterin-binding subunit [Pseudooceanicola sp. 502str34]
MTAMPPRLGRIEDDRLITGQGRYTDDLAQPGALKAYFLRASIANGTVTTLNVEDAREMPGVVAIFTAADLEADGVAAYQAPLNVEGPDGTKYTATERPLLVSDRIRYLGEPLAMILAESLAEAMDAAEAIEVDFDDLDAVVHVTDARAEGAPLVHDDRAGNIGAIWGRGDWDGTRAALEASDKVVHLRLPISRVTAVAMEPRNAFAHMEEGGRLALYASYQHPVALRADLASCFGMEAESIRVVSRDVGGAFGMKSGPLREEMLVFWAAKMLGQPVRWRADRSEDFLSDEGGRDMVFDASLGLDAEGHFTALSVEVLQNIGAYATGRSMPAILNIGGIAGVYRTPAVAARIELVLTNTVPVTAYRGAGRPEATFIIEQLVDKAARQLGLDPIELRRRNLIQPDQMPWTSPFIFDYDSGDFPAILDAGLKKADAEGFAARKAESEAKGLLRGFGLALCVETSGGPYGRKSDDATDISFNADGTVTVAVGAFSAGQGLETAMVDLAAAELGLSPDRIRYVQGDTETVKKGKGMGGSSAMILGGSALQDGVSRVIAQAKKIAGDALEADAADIEYDAGTFRIAGTDREIEMTEVAKLAAESGVQLIGRGIFETDGPTFPNGCHVAEVEIDPETGRARLDRYSAIEDIGVVLNPQLAEGQIHGGAVQALGQVFLEEMRYGEGDGQLLTGTFMDYAMPRAEDMPLFNCGFHEVPTALNPLKVKGVGEAGSVGGMAAGMSAVCDALAQRGVEDFAMPASPGRVWAALDAAKG